MTTTKRKKILWLSHFVPYPPNIGAVQRSYNLLRELTKYHDVILLAFNQGALLKNDNELKDSIENLNHLCEIADVIQIPCDRTPLTRKLEYLKSLFSRRPFTLRWLLSKEYGKRIQEIIKSRSIDAIHFDTISLAPYLDMTDGIKSTLTHHNIESDMMLRRADQERNPLKRLYMALEGHKLRKSERFYCPKFSANLTCSTLDKDRLLKQVADLQENSVHVIPNGVDPSRFVKPQQEEKNNTLIFAGGMGWYPNCSAMLFFAQKIWPLLKQRLADIKMYVVGPDPHSYLTSLAKSDPDFIVTGFVDDVRPYIESAAVYVCPITDGGGTKLKVLEALAMSKALVAHPIACEGIDVRNGESVVFAETAEQFATEIIRLLNNKELRKKLSSAGKKLALEKYSYESIGKKLAQIYDSRN